MKYKYIGEVPTLLIEHNIEAQPGDVIEVDATIDSVFFVPVDDASAKKTNKGAGDN